MAFLINVQWMDGGNASQGDKHSSVYVLYTHLGLNAAFKSCQLSYLQHKPPLTAPQKQNYQCEIIFDPSWRSED